MLLEVIIGNPARLGGWDDGRDRRDKAFLQSLGNGSINLPVTPIEAIRDDLGGVQKSWDRFLGENNKNNSFQNYTNMKGEYDIQIVDMTGIGWITPTINMNFQGKRMNTDYTVNLTRVDNKFYLTAFGRYEPLGQSMFNRAKKAPSPDPSRVYYRYREQWGGKNDWSYIYGSFPFPNNVSDINQSGFTIIR